MILRALSIEKYIDHKKSILIIGPRGSGKSYFLKNQIIPSLKIDYRYIDLLKASDFNKYLKSPNLLNEEISAELKKKSDLIVIIDEIQRLPNLLNEVHSMIEEFKNRIQFILTGSSARKLKRVEANLLAGRAFIINFSILNSNEISFPDNFENIIQYGLLPEVFIESDNKFKEEFLKNYCFTYLKEEIQQEALVRNLESFSKFLELSAQSNGASINCSKIARQIGTASKTVQEYYNILEDTLLVCKIPAWERSIRKQLQKNSKYYFFDTGVLNSLNGELKTELKKGSYRFGALFENLIITEVVKLNNLLNLEYILYHYRTNTGQEIDLILERKHDKRLIAIEIKSDDGSTMQNKQEFAALQSFKEENPNAEIYVFCTAKIAFQRFGIMFVPFMEGLKIIQA